MAIFEKPQNEFEEIANAAEVRRQENRKLGDYGPPGNLFPGPTPIYLRDEKTGVSQTDKPASEPLPNSREDLGIFTDRPPKGSLSLDAQKRKKVTPQTASKPATPTTDWMQSPFGWDSLDRITESVKFKLKPNTCTNLIRMSRGGYPVARTYSPEGHPIAYYDGRGHQDLNCVACAICDFLIPDEPAIAWLRNLLPADPIALPENTGLRGIKKYPYSAIDNVLIVCDVRGLVAGVEWAYKLQQIEKFGGMPVIAFPKSHPGVLRLVNWKNVTLRVSDKTWQLAKDHLPHDQRKDLA